VKFPKPERREKVRRRVRRVRRTRPGVPTEKELDDLARALCRGIGKCEAAGWALTPCNGGLQWAHIVSRQYRRNNLRWRMDNCLCLCAGHHFRWTRKNEAEWRMFLRSKIGAEKMESLDREAVHGDKPDRHAALAYLLGIQRMRSNAL
jgi:hypothetical protein